MSSHDSSESSSESEQEVGLTPYMFEPKRTREQLQQHMKAKNEEEQQGEEEIKQPRVGHQHLVSLSKKLQRNDYWNTKFML